MRACEQFVDDLVGEIIDTQPLGTLEELVAEVARAQEHPDNPTLLLIKSVISPDEPHHMLFSGVSGVDCKDIARQLTAQFALRRADARRQIEFASSTNSVTIDA